VITKGAGQHVGGLPIGPVRTHREVQPGPTARGVLSGWHGTSCMSGLDAQRNTDVRPGSIIIQAHYHSILPPPPFTSH